MRVAKVLPLLLIIVLLLAACVEDNRDNEPIGRDHVTPPPTVAVPTSTPFVPPATPYEVADFDLDNDGELAPSEVKPAVIGIANQTHFAPGYEFDDTRFGLQIDRVLNTGWRTWSFGYPARVIVPAQTCSWLQFWHDSVTAGHMAEADIALGKASDLAQNRADLGDLAGPVESMITAAEAQDPDKLMAIFTQANCQMT